MGTDYVFSDLGEGEFRLRLEHVGTLRIIDILPSGINRPLLVIDDNEQRWVRKDMESGGLSSQGLCGEILAYLIGRPLGIPMPAGAVWKGPHGERAWLSAFLEDVLTWNSARPTPAWQELGSILAMDIVLLNRDRNPGNILVKHRPTPQAWAIDHERIGAAELRFLRAHVNSALFDLPGHQQEGSQPGGLCLDKMKAAAFRMAMAMSSQTQQSIQDSVQLSARLSGGDTQIDEHGDLLWARMRDAPALVERYFSWRGVR